MNRVNVIQSIINRKKRVKYLEIGVDKGECFLLVRAKQKYAVDPHFNITLKSKVKWTFKNPCNMRAKYYEVGSDDYFAYKNHYGGYDVVFIDGLHTYQQVLADVFHALSCLKERGVVIVHDCNPPDEAAAHPADSYAHAGSLDIPAWKGV